MKKAVFYCLFVLLASCSQTITQADLAQLNGYWEIEKVVLENGEEKEYSANTTYDFFEVKDTKAYRQKVMPSLDGTFQTNQVFESITVSFENDKAILNYSTPYAKWKEQLIGLTQDKLIIENEQKVRYHYKKTGPIRLDGDGKTTR